MTVNIGPGTELTEFHKLRDHRRNGNVRPVVIKGKKAQGWEWIAEELIDPEAAE